MNCKRYFCLSLLLAMLAGTSLMAGDSPAGWASGVGTSRLADAKAAGEEAASKAKEQLKGSPAKVVMVGAASKQTTDALIEGVAQHFSKDIIYGGQITSPLTYEDNFPDSQFIDVDTGVCVWAIGGDADITVAVVQTDMDDDDPYYEAGLEMGKKLRPAVESSTRPGKIVFTFGDQNNGPNKDYAAGLNDGLGGTYAIIGGAAGDNTALEIIQGEIVTGHNFAFLLAGDFGIGQAFNGGTHTPETADRTMAQALKDGGDPFFAIVVNCRRRRQGMIEHGQLADELQAIRKHLGDIKFFGFYGPGEIGAKKFGMAAEGLGFTVTTAVFFPLDAGGEDQPGGD